MREVGVMHVAKIGQQAASPAESDLHPITQRIEPGTPRGDPHRVRHQIRARAVIVGERSAVKAAQTGDVDIVIRRRVLRQPVVGLGRLEFGDQ